jgi:hypothetical protein
VAIANPRQISVLQRAALAVSMPQFDSAESYVVPPPRNPHAVTTGYAAQAEGAGLDQHLEMMFPG